MLIKDARLIAVYGRRGSGKTTKVKELVEKCRRLVTFDPCDEYSAEPGMVRVTKNRELWDALRKGWGGGFRIAFVPHAAYEAAQLHCVALILMAFQAAYKRGEDKRKITLVVDEMNLSYPVYSLPAELFGMTQLCNQGRHFGVEIIGVTQGAPQINSIFRRNAVETYVFPLGWAADQKEVLQILGPRHADELRSLRDHEYLFYQNGIVRKGRNRPIGKGRKTPIGKAAIRR